MTYNLRPSASNIWTKCYANPRISENAKVIAQDTDAAREGTCAAWVAECIIRGIPVDVDSVHENEWVVDEEMMYFVGEYIKTIRARGSRILAEQFVRLSPHIAGTFDSLVLSDDGTTAYLVDLKYGYKIVEVYHNTQPIIYGYAALMALNDPKITSIVLGIYQPRAWHSEGSFRTWRLSIPEIHKLASEIAAAGEECQKPDVPATPGSHCEYCKGRLECEALAHSLYNGFEALDRKAQGVMNADELSNELNFLERLKDLYDARKTAVHAEANHRISSGEQVPGWCLKDRTGHRKWRVDPVTLHMLTGINPTKQEIMQPAELERAGADKKIIKGLAYSPNIGHKLDRVDFDKMFRDR